MFAVKAEPGQACSHFFGGHLPSNLAFVLHDRQVPSPYPSHFGMTTEGLSVPIVNCFRRPKNLKDLLVGANLRSTPSELPGNYLCGASRCKTCPILKVTDEFSSHMTGQVYKEKVRASCKSSNIVYLFNMWMRQVNHSVQGSMVTGSTSCTGGLTYPLWPSILIAEHTRNRT